jgi:DNA-binding CsgD family transcriptional regulator
MEAIEITLLVLSYTIVILALFLEFVCYQRNIETLETIGLTFSLLLLIVALTYRQIFDVLSISTETDLFTQISRVLVGLATPLNVLEERRHKINPIFKKGIFALSVGLLLLVFAGYFLGVLKAIHYVVMVFLVTTVVFSMILIRKTKPRVNLANREKMDRFFAITFMIVVPLTFLANYLAEYNDITIRIGFTLPMVFILLAGNKIGDDMQRLSLFKSEKTIKDQNLINYSLTNREKEIVYLLVKGASYKQISEELFVSLPTVKTHVTNIYKKCKINNKIELITLVAL